MGMPPWCHLATCTLTSLSMLWGMWAGVVCEPILTRWNPPSDAWGMATLTSAPVLLFKMTHFDSVNLGGACSFSLSCLCSLTESLWKSERSTRSLSCLSASPFLWRPLIFCMSCLVRLSLIFFPLLTGTTNSAISSRTLWTIFWLAKPSNKPISLTTWLAVSPFTCNLTYSNNQVEDIRLWWSPEL